MHFAKSKILTSACLATTLMLGACNSTTGPTEPDMPSNWSAVTTQTWQLTRVKEKQATIVPMSPVFASARFGDDGKVTGSTGCNQYFADYSHDDGGLQFGQIGATKMYCVDAAMEVENALLAALPKVTDWQIENGDLMLLDGDGAVIAAFAAVQKPAK
ncbi:META domain-containing protein [Thalassospira sp. MA62]|nr:META domain-containing protein [Thalassospira sp. MA62]